MRLVLRAPFLLIGAIVMAMMIDVQISLIFIGVALIIGVVLFFIMSRSGRLYRVIQSQLDRVSLLTRENLTGTRVVRAFSRQEEENEDFTEAAGKLAKTSRTAGIISGLLNPLTYVLVNLAIVLIIWLSGARVEAGELTTGNIMAFVSYLSQILLALVVFANLLVTFTKASACAKRINEVLKTEPSLTYPETDELTPVAGAAKIKFQSVNFDYAKSTELDLEGISITILPGQTVGVIGSTGSGKTTFVNLLARFYDALSGAVELDGHPIAAYPKDQLRRKIGVVPQTAVLFFGTVRQNMQWGNENASDEEIWRALKAAQAADFVQNLEDGLDSVILQNGKNLSGGQRQRLTIARAIVQNPEILILDDSSSALDYATDAALRKALKTELTGLTVIMVSQRATSLKHADQILVLEDGRQAGLGPHAELLETCEVYKEICQSQEKATK
jgi:ATP-binding cassette subfamily B protein